MRWCSSVAGPKALQPELLWYRELATHIRVRSPRLYATVELDGHTWMMLEDVGSEPYDSRRPEHRLALTRWLLAVHRDARSLDSVARLPAITSETYMEHLRGARTLVEENLDNPVLDRQNRAFLDGVLGTLEATESRWPDLEAACDDCPPTIVHGDLGVKNVRISRDGGVAQAIAVDWETAGWGVPAPDLSVSRLRMLSPCPSLGLYSRSPERLGGLSLHRLRRLSLVGTIFRVVAGMDWVAERLATPHVRRPLRDLAEFQIALDSQLGRLAATGRRRGAA